MMVYIVMSCEIFMLTLTKLTELTVPAVGDSAHNSSTHISVVWILVHTDYQESKYIIIYMKCISKAMYIF